MAAPIQKRQTTATNATINLTLSPAPCQSNPKGQARGLDGIEAVGPGDMDREVLEGERVQSPPLPYRRWCRLSGT